MPADSPLQLVEGIVCAPWAIRHLHTGFDCISGVPLGDLLPTPGRSEGAKNMNEAQRAAPLVASSPRPRIGTTARGWRNNSRIRWPRRCRARWRRQCPFVSGWSRYMAV